MAIKDQVKCGDKVNKLTAISNPYKKEGSRKYFIDTICDCPNGTVKTVYEYHMRSGATKSCGCIRDENTSKLNFQHGMYRTRTHTTWKLMQQRCNNPNNPDYPNYGERGISICDRWLEPGGDGFLNFLEDMGERPEGYEIDRVDVNGNYEKSNCRWEKDSMQMHNRRKTKGATSEFLGVSYDEARSVWICKITKDGRNTVKLFSNEISAAEEYDNLSFTLYGDRPNKNKINLRKKLYVPNR